MFPKVATGRTVRKREKVANHSSILSRSGVPPCGFKGAPIMTLTLEWVTCGNCQSSLLTAMGEGRLNRDVEEWHKFWSKESRYWW